METLTLYPKITFFAKLKDGTILHDKDLIGAGKIRTNMPELQPVVVKGTSRLVSEWGRSRVQFVIDGKDNISEEDVQK